MTRFVGQTVFHLVLVLCLAAQGIVMASAGPVGATISAVICHDGERQRVTIDLSTGAPVEADDCCDGCWHCPCNTGLAVSPLVSSAVMPIHVSHTAPVRGDATAKSRARGLPPPARGPPVI